MVDQANSASFSSRLFGGAQRMAVGHPVRGIRKFKSLPLWGIFAHESLPDIQAQVPD